MIRFPSTKTVSLPKSKNTLFYNIRLNRLTLNTNRACRKFKQRNKTTLWLRSKTFEQNIVIHTQRVFIFDVFLVLIFLIIIKLIPKLNINQIYRSI